jgi:hypothetical protein
MHMCMDINNIIVRETIKTTFFPTQRGRDKCASIDVYWGCCTDRMYMSTHLLRSPIPVSSLIFPRLCIMMIMIGVMYISHRF